MSIFSPFFELRVEHRWMLFAAFAFNFGFQDRLFHSRRIGLSEEGEAVRILGGSRLVGRVGAWDVGLIDMQTGRSSDLPSENFGVLRLRRSQSGRQDAGRRFGSVVDNRM